MCLVESHGSNPFYLEVTRIICEECGCSEGWKEVGNRYLVQCRGHEHLKNYGIVDDVIMLEHTAWCPECNKPVDSHWIDCKREAVGVMAEVGCYEEERDTVSVEEVTRRVGLPILPAGDGELIDVGRHGDKGGLRRLYDSLRWWRP